MFTFFFFLFGSLLGSFSNVVILRMSSGVSVIFPPSSCPKCNHRLHAIDLAPIFSWVFLRGRCRYCQAPISWQYPVVEATIACIVGISFFKVGLKPEFVVLASKSVIWFIATVLFIRREVLQPGPYIWPAMIFILFNFPLNGCPFISKPIAAAPFIAIGLGYLATFRNKFEANDAWAGLSFLFLFAMAPGFAFYAAIPLVTLAIAATIFPSKHIIVERIFCALQIIAIFTTIFLNH